MEEDKGSERAGKKKCMQTKFLAALDLCVAFFFVLPPHAYVCLVGPSSLLPLSRLIEFFAASFLRFAASLLD